jgi:hypothetical protein
MIRLHWLLDTFPVMSISGTSFALPWSLVLAHAPFDCASIRSTYTVVNQARQVTIFAMAISSIRTQTRSSTIRMAIEPAASRVAPQVYPAIVRRGSSK